MVSSKERFFLLKEVVRRNGRIKGVCVCVCVCVRRRRQGVKESSNTTRALSVLYDTHSITHSPSRMTKSYCSSHWLHL